MVKVDIFHEILWPQFKALNEVIHLSENEKIRQYNFYLQELQLQRISYLNWLEGTTKGGSEEDDRKSTPTPIPDEFLLQENEDFLLQENDDKIIL